MTAPETHAETRLRQRRVVMVVDLAGFARAFQTKSDEDLGTFIDDYYRLVERVVATRGGTVVKFTGDGALVTFAEDGAESAVRAAIDLERTVDELATEHGLSVQLGASIHLAAVIEGRFGGAHRPVDIIGRGVNQTFLLGRGPGIRISEPVYRQLPNDARSPWSKHKPPAIYHLSSSGLLEGLGKDPGTNSGRW